jgi:hypothetical protein
MRAVQGGGRHANRTRRGLRRSRLRPARMRRGGGESVRDNGVRLRRHALIRREPTLARDFDCAGCDACAALLAGAGRRRYRRHECHDRRQEQPVHLSRGRRTGWDGVHARVRQRGSGHPAQPARHRSDGRRVPHLPVQWQRQEGVPHRAASERDVLLSLRRSLRHHEGQAHREIAGPTMGARLTSGETWSRSSNVSTGGQDIERVNRA